MAWAPITRSEADLSRVALRISVVFVLAALAFLRWPIVSPVQAGDISSDTDQDGSSESGERWAVRWSASHPVVAPRRRDDRSEDVDVTTERVGLQYARRHGWHNQNRADPLQLVTEALEELPGGDFLTCYKGGNSRIPKGLVALTQTRTSRLFRTGATEVFEVVEALVLGTGITGEFFGGSVDSRPINPVM